MKAQDSFSTPFLLQVSFSGAQEVFQSDAPDQFAQLLVRFRSLHHRKPCQACFGHAIDNLPEGFIGIRHHGIRTDHGSEWLGAIARRAESLQQILEIMPADDS